MHRKSAYILFLAVLGLLAIGIVIDDAVVVEHHERLAREQAPPAREHAQEPHAIDRRQRAAEAALEDVPPLLLVVHRQGVSSLLALRAPSRCHR